MAATTTLHNIILKYDSREDVNFLDMTKPSNSELNDTSVGHNDPTLVNDIGEGESVALIINLRDEIT